MRILPRRRREPKRPNRRTIQRICAVVTAILRADKDEFTVQELCWRTSQGAGSMHVVLAWMERLALVSSYWEEPVLPDAPRRRLYSLTGHAYKWANEALLEGRNA